MVEMLSREQQVAKLDLVARIASQAECNIELVVDPADVVCLRAMHTPNASEIVHPLSDGGYDVWRWGTKRKRLAETDVSAERAAEIVVGEYLKAKAKRVKKLYPHMSMKEIIKTLSKGYQHKRSTEH